MVRVKILKNTFNKSQFNKWVLLSQLVAQLKYEIMPADSGYNSSQFRALFGNSSYAGAAFANVVVKHRDGDPLTSATATATLDPSLLTAEQCNRIKRLLSWDFNSPTNISVIQVWMSNNTNRVDIPE